MSPAERLARALATADAVKAVQVEFIALSERIRSLHCIVISELQAATDAAVQREDEMPTNVQPEPRRTM